MNRRLAKSLHTAANFSYRMEQPGFYTGFTLADTALKTYRAIPLNSHEHFKNMIFDSAKVIAVSGESVVVDDGRTVDKFMLRYPGKISIESFRTRAELEIDTVLAHLGKVAIPTKVGIKSGKLFRHSAKSVKAVAQTQLKLDTSINPPINLKSIVNDAYYPFTDQTARDLESLVNGADTLISDHGYFPDIALSSGNLRCSMLDGRLTLIDVLPFYNNGSRLIGDRPPQVIPTIENDLNKYRAFVGQFGG